MLFKGPHWTQGDHGYGDPSRLECKTEQKDKTMRRSYMPESFEAAHQGTGSFLLLLWYMCASVCGYVRSVLLFACVCICVVCWYVCGAYVCDLICVVGIC